MESFKDVKEKLGARESRKVGNNTYLQLRGTNAIAVKLHQTDVVTYHADGSITLNSGGWRTVTTKDRINDWLPGTWYVSQRKGVWYLVDRATYKDIGRFEDGLTIKADGTFEKLLPLIPKMESIDRNLKRRIKAYSLAFVQALEAGEVTPSKGDCFFCLMREVNTGKPLGELTKSNHLDSHIKEGYFVFSLLERALETLGPSIAMREFVAASVQGSPDKNIWGVDFIRDQVVKMLYRYICRQYGYAV